MVGLSLPFGQHTYIYMWVTLIVHVLVFLRKELASILFYELKRGCIHVLRTFAQKFSNIDFFVRLLPLKVDELVVSEM